jgi:hypothetical protein
MSERVTETGVAPGVERVMAQLLDSVLRAKTGAAFMAYRDQVRSENPFGVLVTTSHKGGKKEKGRDSLRSGVRDRKKVTAEAS